MMPEQHTIVAEDEDRHHIESDGEVDTVEGLDVSSRYPLESLALLLVHRIIRKPLVCACATGLHVDEDERLIVDGDDVGFACLARPIAGEDLVAPQLEVAGGGFLSLPSKFFVETAPPPRRFRGPTPWLRSRPSGICSARRRRTPGRLRAPGGRRSSLLPSTPRVPRTPRFRTPPNPPPEPRPICRSCRWPSSDPILFDWACRSHSFSLRLHCLPSIRNAESAEAALRESRLPRGGDGWSGLAVFRPAAGLSRCDAGFACREMIPRDRGGCRPRFGTTQNTRGVNI